MELFYWNVCAGAWTLSEVEKVTARDVYGTVFFVKCFQEKQQQTSEGGIDNAKR